MDSDERHLRVSHADRDAVAERLRRGAGEGFIDLGELEERLGLAYAARTRGDLASLTVDLPPEPGLHGVPGGGSALEQRPQGAPPAVTDTGHGGALSLRAVFGDCHRRGTWNVPERIHARSVMGDVTLDLREASLGPRTEIETSATLGDVTVVVNARTRVELSGRGVLGNFREARSTVAADVGADSPIVVVSGRAVFGSVTVKRRGMPGELRRRLLGG